MAYAPHTRQGPAGGYNQQSRGPAQGAPTGYQYDDPSQSQGYGYSSNGGYGEQTYEEPAPVAYHGKARYVGHAPQAQNFNDGSGYDQQGAGYGHGGYEQRGHNQGAYDQGGYDRDNYNRGYRQDDRYGQQSASAGGGGGSEQSFGTYHQQRPTPQRSGHNAPPSSHSEPRQQSQNRPMNDRPPPTRQYTDVSRPSTSSSSMPRATGSEASRRHDVPPNGYQPRTRGPNPSAERPLQNQPNSPQTAGWDNPFGSFGSVAPPKETSRSRRDEQRPSTSHSASNRHQQNGLKSSESPRPHQRPPQQQGYGEYQSTGRQDYGQQNYNPQAGGYDQPSRDYHPSQQDMSDSQRDYPGSAAQQPYAQKGFTPNFSRVQSPPIRNGQTPPNMGIERSNTMPAELPVRTVNSSTPTPSFQSDLPFREGRAQTPVYASPQYAEAQSAVIESVSDPPTATNDWTGEGVGHDNYHQPAHSMHSQQGHRPGQPSNGYGDFYDDYYSSREIDASATGDMDMPNFGKDQGHDELHLDSGTPMTGPVRTAYSQDPIPPNSAGPASGSYQKQGFDFGVDSGATAGGGYDGYAMDNQTQRSFSSPPQNHPNYPGGRGMPPPGRGMPPGRGGLLPNRGRGGYPGPQDRSATAPPGQRPNGVPYGSPGSGGRGVPPMRGRGGPSGFTGDPRGPPGSAPGPGQGPGGPGRPGGPGGPGPMGGRGGAPPGSRGRGGPPGGGPGPGRGQPPTDMAGQPPAPVRPGLMQQGGGPAGPPPVRQYNSAPGIGQPEPVAGSDGPVTMAELQKLRMAVSDNPGDQDTTMILVKKLVEASNVLAGDEGRADPKTKAKNRERYVNEAYKLVKKLCTYNNKNALFYMAECYGSGQLGLPKDPKEAFLLYQSAAKIGHAPSAYRVAVCCELGENEGGGTKRDPLKAMQWYERAAKLGDMPAMYKLGVILLKGLLGQDPKPGEAVNWLQRAADRADAENPHALHELGLLYEAPPPQVQNKIFPDQNYSFEFFSQAAALGYKFSQYRLGQCFEYGQLGCPIDPRQSIGWYSKAAVQEEHQSELALSGWYLTGSESVIQQSDTEAYLWARKAAQAGLAKAEYAMGYFTETGIGCSANLEDAKRWYWRASAQNFPKARERLEDLRRGGAKAAQARVSRTTMQRNHGDCKAM